MKLPLLESVINIHFYVTNIYLQIWSKDAHIGAQNNHTLLFKINSDESSYKE